MDAIESLKLLTSKQFIYFFNSGDDAILYLMKYLANNGLKKILIPDCGGWFSYKKYPKKSGLEIVEINTDDALIDVRDFESKISKDCFLLINSIGGYFVEEPMKEIEKICKDNNIILMNDVSASIGTELAYYGDFCIGSFGEYKPIELGRGGFIGSNIELSVDKSDFEDEENMRRLDFEINRLNTKLVAWRNIRNHIMQELDDNQIIHKESSGINVIVAFDDEPEKENLINYCDKHNLNYVICPNYIKVNRSAVSIEIKRIKEV